MVRLVGQDLHKLRQLRQLFRLLLQLRVALSAVIAVIFSLLEVGSRAEPIVKKRLVTFRTFTCGKIESQSSVLRVQRWDRLSLVRVLIGMRSGVCFTFQRE